MRLLVSALLLSLVALMSPTANAQEPNCTQVPNANDVPFEVCDDELFIFAANHKPFENKGFFEKYVGKPIKEQFPDIKLKFAAWDVPVRYTDLEAAGVVPDIILENPRNRIDRDLEPLGWAQDMTPMLEEGGVDLSKFNQAAVEQVRSRSDGGLYGVPLFINEHVLLYNKKIFDKLDVRYPKPGMTYDEAYRMAKQLTRQVGLDAYKGYLQHPDNYLEYNQAGVYPFENAGSEQPAPEDVKVNITSDEWMRLGVNMERFLLIPRNVFTSVDDFASTGKVAMAVDTLHKMNMYALSEDYIEDGDEALYQEWMKNVDLGVVPVPVLDRDSDAIYQPNLSAAFIPPQSDSQQQAFDVVRWLASEEGQLQFSESGMKAVLETDDVVEGFGAGIPELAGVDTSAVYWGDNAVVRDYKNTEFWEIPLYMVFRKHVLLDGMTVQSSLIVTETVDIPAYIKSQAAAGKDW